MPNMIKLKDLKKDQVVYECRSGHNLKCTCLEDARDTGEGWACNVETEKFGVELYEAYKSGGHGPRLYDEPQYIEKPTEI